ncbi:MAG: hypothetical protein HYR94_21975 [Chloroflexi bacterium]|nr:hypothetical protein [Chloroflexota bacterium]
MSLSKANQTFAYKKAPTRPRQLPWASLSMLLLALIILPVPVACAITITVYSEVRESCLTSLKPIKSILLAGVTEDRRPMTGCLPPVAGLPSPVSGLFL